MSTLSKATFLSQYAGGAGSFKNNSTREITELIMRTFAQDGGDSFLFLLDHAYSSFAVSASGTNTYTATLSPAITSYLANQRVAIRFTNGNTGASTLNLNGLGAIPIRKNGATPLISGDIASGQILFLIYDGVNFQIVGVVGGTAGGGGHVIQNSGTPLTTRANLNLTSGLEAVDDSVNDASIVGIANGGVTFARFQNIATDRLVGRDAAGSGVAGEISLTGGLEFTGSDSIQVSAFTGDVTKTAGGTVLTITDDAVTDLKLRNSAAVSVIGRSVNTSGDPADISAGANDRILRRTSDTLNFGQLTVGMAPANVWTYATIQQVAASRLLGNPTGAPANIAEIGLGSGLEFTGGNVAITAAYGNQFWNLASGGTLSGANTISGAHKIGFTNDAIGIGVAPGSITANTRLDIRGAGTGTNVTFRTANSSNTQTFEIRDDGRVTVSSTVGGGNIQHIVGSTGNGFAHVLNEITSTNSLVGYANSLQRFAIQATGSGGVGLFIDVLNANNGPILRNSSGDSTVISVLQLQTSSVLNSLNPTSSTARTIFSSGINFIHSVTQCNTTFIGYFGTWSMTINGTYFVAGVAIKPTINLNGLSSTVTLYGFDYNPTVTDVSGATHIAFRATSGSVLIGDTSLTTNTRLQVRGIGITTGLTLLLKDSSGTDTFGFQDDGKFYQYITPVDASTGHHIILRNNTTGEFTKLGLGANLSISAGLLDATGGGGGLSHPQIMARISLKI